MSLMSYTELCELVDFGVIEGVEYEQVNASSIDVRLGNELIIETYNDNYGRAVDPKLRTNFASRRVDLTKLDHYDMQPGEFVLAHTVEKFNLPMDVSAEFRLKSSGARSGLNNLFACHCDPGWTGSTLTLELHNCLRQHQIRLTPGMFIGQMLFHRHRVPVPKDRSYTDRGRYNNDASVSQVKL